MIIYIYSKYLVYNIAPILRGVQHWTVTWKVAIG